MIPESACCEILHGTNLIPPEVDNLKIIGGSTDPYNKHGGQLRICEHCQAYFQYTHDHDSESGVGIGYTDVSIKRLTRSEALQLCTSALKYNRINILAYEKSDNSYLLNALPRLRIEEQRLTQTLLTLS